MRAAAGALTSIFKAMAASTTRRSAPPSPRSGWRKATRMVLVPQHGLGVTNSRVPAGRVQRFLAPSSLRRRGTRHHFRAHAVSIMQWPSHVARSLGLFLECQSGLDRSRITRPSEPTCHAVSQLEWCVWPWS